MTRTHCARSATFAGSFASIVSAAGLALLGTPLLAADPTGSGPEPATTYSDPSLPTHTIYRPERLAGSYPVVLWGNGSCVDSNFAYREFLAEVASHGFIVLAIGPYRDSPAPRLERSEDPAEWPPFETRYSQMFDALEWITAENDRSGSPFHRTVAVDKVAVMGHSCGGLQAVKASEDPRVTTVLVLNSGMMADGDQYMERHELTRSILERMHAPIAYFIGGESEISRNETRWSFTPSEPWREGSYHLVVLGILEDLAGNRIGRPFEVDVFEPPDGPEEQQTYRIPFVVVPASH